MPCHVGQQVALQQLPAVAHRIAEQGEVLGRVGAAAADVGDRAHQLAQPLLELGIGHVGHRDVGPVVVLAGGGDHGRQPAHVLARVGHHQLEEAPARIAAQLGPAALGDGRIVDRLPGRPGRTSSRAPWRGSGRCPRRTARSPSAGRGTRHRSGRRRGPAAPCRRRWPAPPGSGCRGSRPSGSSSPGSAAPARVSLVARSCRPGCRSSSRSNLPSAVRPSIAMTWTSIGWPSCLKLPWLNVGRRLAHPGLDRQRRQNAHLHGTLGRGDQRLRVARAQLLPGQPAAHHQQHQAQDQ